MIVSVPAASAVVMVPVVAASGGYSEGVSWPLLVHLLQPLQPRLPLEPLVKEAMLSRMMAMGTMATMEWSKKGVECRTWTAVVVDAAPSWIDCIANGCCWFDCGF